MFFFCNVSTPAMHCGTFHRGDLRTVVSMATTSHAQFDLAATEPNLCGDVSPSCGNPQMLLWVYANMSTAVSVQIILMSEGNNIKTWSFMNVRSAIAMGFGLVVDTMQGRSGTDFETHTLKTTLRRMFLRWLFGFSFTSNSLSSQHHPDYPFLLTFLTDTSCKCVSVWQRNI